MFCKHCGKELSDEAFMCPDCGEPTGVIPKFANNVKKESAKNTDNDCARNAGMNPEAVAVIALIFSCIALVTGVVFGAFFFVYSYSVYLLFVLGATTILPAFAGLGTGVYSLMTGKEGKSVKVLSIISIALSAFTLLFLFIGGCAIVAA